jgi:hypothetical protein
LVELKLKKEVVLCPAISGISTTFLPRPGLKTPQNRKQIDRTIHQIMAIEYKQCPVTWKKLKEQVLNNEAGRRDFIARLKKAV